MWELFVEEEEAEEKRRPHGHRMETLAC